MEKIKNLNSIQKAILLVMLVMILVFTVVYPKIMSRVGFAYQGTILTLSEDNGVKVYSGKRNGQPISFAVSKDHTIEFHYGDSLYGPYIVKWDPTAVPKGMGPMEGVELRKGEEVLFRGGIYDADEFYLLYNEDGTINNSSMVSIVADENTIITDEKGKRLDPLEPSVSALVELMKGPELAHKGDRTAWFGGVAICIINTIMILFADELFRLKMAFRIRNVEEVIPSGFEIAGRYIAWSTLTIMALVIFVLGLQSFVS